MTPKPINYFHDHLIECYGQRVQKLCLDGGFTCPNRDGSKSFGGCLFCDSDGSGAGKILAARPVGEQVARQKALCQRRYGAKLFIAYFQAFTNTYAPVERLRFLYDQALASDDVIGLSVGTRADCLDEQVCDLLASYMSRSRRVWVEIGVQTVNQATLDRMNRAEGVEDFRRAAQLVKQRNLELVVHVIVGLPGDGIDDFLATVDFVNTLNADGIKIHNLYVDSRAPLAALWRKGDVPILSFGDYVSAVAQGVARLSSRCLVHRLSGQAPKPYHLAPEWALDKNRVIRAVEAELLARGAFHGSLYSPPASAGG
ncbi:MAG: TIGR01212 family radical SAM protein [Candidatus Sumerlaeaceae bacterium]|nr:TIGR01212 family radical SAM protein [Candidatus Sumerlaeaceae bacterium]